MLVGKDGRPHVPDAVERRANALASLKLICESPVFFPHLELLLATQDSQGNTPFMASIANRAYPASLVLLEAAIRVAKDSSNDEETQRKTLMACVFPENSPPTPRTNNKKTTSGHSFSTTNFVWSANKFAR